MAKKCESGALLVLRERKRQIAEGHTPENDLKHHRGELAYAAASYLVRGPFHDRTPPGYWPWPDPKWKPNKKDRIAELAKAGALILAEIDRLRHVQEDL